MLVCHNFCHYSICLPAVPSWPRTPSFHYLCRHVMSDAYVQSSPVDFAFHIYALPRRAKPNFDQFQMLTRTLASTEALLLHLLFTVVTVPFRCLTLACHSSEQAKGEESYLFQQAQPSTPHTRDGTTPSHTYPSHSPPSRHN